MGYLNKPISVEAQTAAHPHWCWASVTAAVWNYFEGAAFTMAQVVVLVLQPDCSGLFTADQGEHEWDLASALAMDNPGCPKPPHNHFAANGEANGQVAFEDLQHQVDDLQRPVCVALTFDTSGGQLSHYCVINGVFMQDGEPWISLLDPAGVPPGQQAMSFAAFNSGKLTLDSDAAYPAVWSDTFYTQ
jgi:hypothetical protein